MYVLGVCTLPDPGRLHTFPVHYNHTYHFISFIHAAGSLHPFLGRLKSFPRPRALSFVVDNEIPNLLSILIKLLLIIFYITDKE